MWQCPDPSSRRSLFLTSGVTTPAVGGDVCSEGSLFNLLAGAGGSLLGNLWKASQPLAYCGNASSDNDPPWMKLRILRSCALPAGFFGGMKVVYVVCFRK
eukprot:symbB.v1.2.024826.t1/scaffold2374.1/size162163/8